MMDDISRKEAEACDTTPFCNTFLIVVFLFHVFSSCVYSLLFNLPSSSLTPLLERPNDFHDCQAIIRAKNNRIRTQITFHRVYSVFLGGRSRRPQSQAPVWYPMSNPGSSRVSSGHRSSSTGFVHFSRHTLKQLKFVLPGGLVTYLLGTVARFWNLVEKESGWARYVFIVPYSLMIYVDLLYFPWVYIRISARTSLACGVLTVALFLYILLIPWIKGSRPNVRNHSLSNRFRSSALSLQM